MYCATVYLSFPYQNHWIIRLDHFVPFFSFLRPDGKIQLMSGHPSDIEDGKSTEVVDLEAKTSVPGFDLINDYSSVSFNPKTKPTRVKNLLHLRFLAKRGFTDLN